MENCLLQDNGDMLDIFLEQNVDLKGVYEDSGNVDLGSWQWILGTSHLSMDTRVP